MSSPNINAQFDSVFGSSPARRDTVTDRVIAATARTYELEAKVSSLQTRIESQSIAIQQAADAFRRIIELLPWDRTKQEPDSAVGEARIGLSALGYEDESL